MVICKYFLQGTCRYGDTCKFEHQINSDHNYTNASSILLQNKPTTNVDTNTLVKAVVNDMTSAEKGGQWLLSSYAPFKEKPAFPGFEDHSMEEVRYLFYESVKTGTIEQYKQNLQMMLQQAVMKIKALQNPTPDAINMLKSIYNTPPSSSFGNNTNQSTFGGGNGFGGGQTGQKSVFGGTTNPNIFGGNNTNNPQQNIFGSTNPNKSIFGGQNPPNPIFGGGQQQNNQTKSIFGGGQPVAPTSPIFGHPQPTFANQSPIFVGNSPPQQNNIFQQQFQNPPQTSNNQFGVMPPQNSNNQFGVISPQRNPPQTGNNQFGVVPPQSNFSTPPNTNIFGNQFGGAPPQQNLFAPAVPTPSVPNPSSTQPAFQHSQSIFGNLGLQQPSGSVFGGTMEKPNQDFYSRVEDLTEDEIKWFQSDDLDIMNIPEKPPTYEMCFKN